MTKRWLTLLVVALLALGLLNNLTSSAQVIQPTSLPTFTLIPSATVFVVTTLVPTPTPGCAAPLGFVKDAKVFVRSGVFVRYQPSASSPYVNYYHQRTVVTIVAGPVCDGLRFNWWQVKGPGNDGWVAEGSPSNYLMSLGELPGQNCQPAVALAVGKKAVLLRDLNVHQEASQDSLVMTVASTGSKVDVLEGPKCAEDGYNYWKISTVVVGVTYIGWVADAQTGGNDWLISEEVLNAPVCAPPLALPIGAHAFVNYTDHTPKSLRSGPSTDSQLVATLLDGIGFEIIGGPICAQSYNWWQIRILSRPDVTGWLAEGGPASYWITGPSLAPTRPI